MSQRDYVGLFAVLSAFLCCGPPAPRPHAPTDTPSCAAACDQLAKLGCVEAQPLEDGTSCEEFCVKTQEAGHRLSPACVMKIERCEQIEECGR